VADLHSNLWFADGRATTPGHRSSTVLKPVPRVPPGDRPRSGKRIHIVLPTLSKPIPSDSPGGRVKNMQETLRSDHRFCTQNSVQLRCEQREENRASRAA
jgi:hypothetical protein